MIDPVLQPYVDMLPLALLAFFAALLLTPLVGFIAEKYHFVDLPATMRKRTDKTLEQRLHDNVKPRLGALAVLIPFILIATTQIPMTTQLSGLFLGLIILTVVGVIDDRYELSGGVQFGFQILAAVIVVVTGTTIPAISVAGLDLDFTGWQTALNLGSFVYNMTLPADIITILWIVTLVNALNWVCGIDALGEGMTIIAAVTMTILSVRFGANELALIPFLLGFGVLGFLPYNYPPSKIIGGTAGHGYGFVLAVLSILIAAQSGSGGNGPKLTTAIIILSIPLIDMIWVLINRMRNHKTVNILKLFSISGREHLHHRLMDAGFSAKQTLYIETSAMAIIALVAFQFGGFNTGLVAGIAVITALIVAFTLISLRNRRNSRSSKAIVKKPDGPQPPIVDTGPTPEERFAY
ncbi:MAG: putative undecaprenyl-phosphate N-acetylglucosaminyl 1-phosphate transferase [candidate division WS6 bacterium OLB20]|uniref:Putative undecaprenyl-phosphate N-acetylglucosaminyl 1-phosphate transferase n=1 Tax=candidate division WS6 bacterium OLB20 TaxID=1617426 RepID=A0A136LWX2_9BACT|nr:MAG: putative undecaprenyl-phosphate N-acetylglucosaminyl 1-phosphate transferase [candidate division WS6 bacterium OLB20]